MYLLHHQVPRSQVPLPLLSLWERNNALAFDLSWPCYLCYIGQGPRPNYTGRDLSDRDLQGAFLWEANLQGANLFRVDLWETNLTGANLSGANLSRANLRGANLRGANLWGTNLTGADLSGANLSRAFRPSNPPPGWKIVNFLLQKE